VLDLAAHDAFIVGFVGNLRVGTKQFAGHLKRFAATHHDLRHLFATRCIENGVDIATVSRWLGHQDGGALCLKTYGHLRDEHSANEAKKATFQGQFSDFPLITVLICAL
jgi:integrase